MLLPARAHAAALACIGGLGPGRLRRLLTDLDPEEAFRRARAGAIDRIHLHCAAERVALLNDQVRSEASRVDVAELWDRIQTLGQHVLLVDDLPEKLASDRSYPPVLFAIGDHEQLDRTSATIIGTRHATGVGRSVAFEFGASLTAHGVSVVSGLAHGIDAAAHAGAVSVDGASPIGVVGSGLDVVYPASSRATWEQVAARGVILSEAPPGARPEPHRFPLRNRLLAALGDVVVVVESRRSGGSMITVDEAVSRNRPVLAVPGSVRSPASDGTNALIFDGNIMVRDPLDVLAAIGLTMARVADLDDRRPVDGLAAVVLDQLGAGPLDLDGLVETTGADLGSVARAIGRLEADRWVRSDAGWYEIDR